VPDYGSAQPYCLLIRSSFPRGVYRGHVARAFSRRSRALPAIPRITRLTSGGGLPLINLYWCLRTVEHLNFSHRNGFRNPHRRVKRIYYFTRFTHVQIPGGLGVPPPPAAQT